MSNEKIIALIRNGGHEKALDVLYANYPAFKNSFKTHGGKADDAEDIFQDADFRFKISAPSFKKCPKVGTEMFRNTIYYVRNQYILNKKSFQITIFS